MCEDMGGADAMWLRRTQARSAESWETAEQQAPGSSALRAALFGGGKAAGLRTTEAVPDPRASHSVGLIVYEFD